MAGTTEKGIMQSFVKKMKDGAHEYYDGANGRLFKFTVVFNCNGTVYTGTANSSKESPSWKVQGEYTFERSTSGNGNYINFSSIKSTEVKQGNGGRPYSGGGGSKSNPDFAKKKAVEGAFSVTAMICNRIKEINPSIVINEMAYDKVAGALSAFLIGSGNENEIWDRLTALNIVANRDVICKMNIAPDKNITKVYIEQAMVVIDTINKYKNGNYK